MPDESHETSTDGRAGDFAQQAADERVGLIGEFFAFLRYNKKWWLLPIIVLLVLAGILVALSGTAAAPFIYTLF